MRKLTKLDRIQSGFPFITEFENIGITRKLHTVTMKTFIKDGGIIFNGDVPSNSFWKIGSNTNGAVVVTGNGNYTTRIRKITEFGNKSDVEERTRMRKKKEKGKKHCSEKVGIWPPIGVGGGSKGVSRFVGEGFVLKIKRM
jgi:hypothetical protein